MIKRTLEDKIRESLTKFPTITLLGPRQSGKTTLLKKLFPDFVYKNLENPTERELATNDPISFLESETTLIIDEVQRCPELLSYIQTIVDSSKRKFILTGSHQLLLSEKISQSLAGRTRIFELLPFSYGEIQSLDLSLDELILKGGYPRIYNENLSSYEWLSQYIQTYIEKDVRQLLNIGDLLVFERFLKILAGRVGQSINYSNLANDVGIKSPTASSWVSILSVSYITFLLPPYFQNFTKRYIKAPKLYFYDTGLLCALLGIRTKEHLKTHPLVGFIFENFVVSEFMKKRIHAGERPDLFYYRDQNKVEVDLIFENGNDLELFEVKYGKTFQSEWLKGIEFLKNQETKKIQSHIIYTGDDRFSHKGTLVRSWKSIHE